MTVLVPVHVGTVLVVPVTAVTLGNVTLRVGALAVIAPTIPAE